MRFLENRGLCLGLMIVLLVAGLLLGGWASLGSLQQEAENVFFSGEDGDGICIFNDMNERAAAATNLVTLARKYSAGDETGELDDACEEVTAAVAQMQAAGTEIAALYQADKVLESTVERLYRALGQVLEQSSRTSGQAAEEAAAAEAGASPTAVEKDEAYRQRLYADFQSRGDTISHDPYIQHAQAYNQTLQKFPASLIKTLTPVNALVISY